MRPRPPVPRRWAFALLLTLATPAPAQEDVAAAARAAAQRITMAAALMEAADTRADRIASLTEAVRSFEDGLVALREGLRRVALRRQVLADDLAARSEQIAQLLAVLIAIGDTPAPALHLHPEGALGTARSGMILADVTPALQDGVTALRDELQELADLAAIEDNARARVEEALTQAQRARAELARAIAGRTDLPRRFTEDPEAMAALTAAADTLDALAGGLSATVGESLAVIVPDALDRKGSLPLPVTGTVLRRAGEPDAAGTARPGWVIATRPRALVTAPVAGTLRYLGPLPGQGNVVILEPAPEVLILMTGLAELFGETGEIVPEGTPLGLMGGAAPDADAILGEGGAGTALAQTETLYLEVREGQAVADPATWFAAG
ncbi:MAG: peptidase M23 [Rubellimicrobium sp.]|nr:peptidase M23 [Rubellimicrobium sp.]